MFRAGWPAGKFRASKLYQSVSTSGPSATENPMATKVSSRASTAWVTRWRWPRRRSLMTSVRSSRSASGRAAGQRLLDRLGLLVEEAALLLALLGRELPERLLALGQLRALAQELGAERGQVIEGGRRPDAVGDGMVRHHESWSLSNASVG